MRPIRTAAGMLVAAGVAYGVAPALAAAFVPSDAGMAVSLLLLYAFYPALSIAVGIASARAMRSLWWAPGVFAGLFLPVFRFTMGVTDGGLLLYAVGYAVAGYAAAAAGFALMRGRHAAP